MTYRDAAVSACPSHELVERAAALAEADDDLRAKLIEARREAGLSQRELASMLGIKQSSVAAFERYDNDPRLSTIRRYALAVGAAIEHRVSPCTPAPPSAAEWTPFRSGSFSTSIQDAPLGVTLSAPSSARSDFALSA